MKISNSKKELARIISENGGWRDGEFAAQDHNGSITMFSDKPYRQGIMWESRNAELEGFIVKQKIANWHQTVLSRAEYFHLYPAPDADGWIEWSGGWCPVGDGVSVEVKRERFIEVVNNPEVINWVHYGTIGDIIAYRLHKPEQAKSTAVGDDETNFAAKEELEAMEYKPSIEQLMQTYADRAHSVQLASEHLATCTKQANEAMWALYVACKAAGFDVSPTTAKQEAELLIAGWRDLQVGDEIEILGDGWDVDNVGEIGVVSRIEVDTYEGELAILCYIGEERSDWGSGFRFIRRP